MAILATEACSEITEGLLLYASLQLNHLSRSSVKQLNPKLRVRIGPTGKAGEASNEREAPQLLREFQVQIEASGLGCYYLDGTSFLNTLCEHGFNFKRSLESTTISELQLLCRCIGEHSTVISCSADLSASPLVFQEAVITRPEHFNPSTILISFNVKWSTKQSKVEPTKLVTHLYLMHITNPEISLECINMMSGNSLGDSGGRECILSFASEPFKHFPRTSIKLATALRHFYNQSVLPARLSKLRLLKGDAYTIPTSVSLTSGSKVTLKVRCTAAVVPSLSLRNGRKIPANRLCKHLHISVFDPSHLPLVSAGSTLNFPLSSLAEWDDFGMELGQCHLSNSVPDCSTITPSYTFEISNLRASGGSRGVSSSMAVKHHLELFVFLEDVANQEKSGLGKNCQWKRSIELHHRLRGAFQNLVVEHSKKFHQAVHSVLNKLICNYGSHAKTQSIMASVIPLVADAVSSIVKNSTNNTFKEDCRNIMETESEEPTATESWVREKLWKLAGDKLRIAPPSDSSATRPNPDEPTSPELILAVSEHSNSESSTPMETQQAESANNLKHDDTNTLKSNTAPPEALEPAASHNLPTETHSSASSSSQAGLFQARMASSKVLTQQTALTDTCDSNEDFDFEALSSFEDVASSNSDESVKSGSDGTVFSDFDELGGVSEGELSFDGESQPPSPVLFSSMSKRPLSGEIDNCSTASGHDHSSLTRKISVEINTVSTHEVEAMDTQNADETMFFSDDDYTTAAIDTFSQEIGTEKGTDFSPATALPCCASDQHMPGRWDQAKKPKDVSTDDSMSHTSDQEWTELSFESPEFVCVSKSGNNLSTGRHDSKLLPTTTHVTISEIENILPTSVGKFGDTKHTDVTAVCALTQTSDTQCHTNSAFDSLEDYDETLSVNEFDTTSQNIYSNQCLMASRCGSIVRGNMSQKITLDTALVEREEVVSAAQDGELICDVTDDDFCWESEQQI